MTKDSIRKDLIQIINNSREIESRIEPKSPYDDIFAEPSDGGYAAIAQSLKEKRPMGRCDCPDCTKLILKRGILNLKLCRKCNHHHYHLEPCPRCYPMGPSSNGDFNWWTKSEPSLAKDA
jgi:hypothetical protein